MPTTYQAEPVGVGAIANDREQRTTAEMQARTQATPRPDHVADVVPVVAATALTVPSGFHRVEVVVVNDDGVPLEKARMVFSPGLFGVVAPVEDAVGHVWLRSMEYSEFVVVAERPGSRADYSWYSAEAQEPINPLVDDQAVIVVSDERITSGVSASMG